MRKECLLFAKQGRAVWISHLDLTRVLARAFARARVPLAYSEGFNPHPYLSSALPLPVGVSSGCEVLFFGVTDTADLSGVTDALNGALPEGLSILRLLEPLPDIKDIAAAAYRYKLRWTSQADCQAALALFDGRTLPIEKKTKKGRQLIDMKPLIQSVNIQRQEGGHVLLDCILSGGQTPASPTALLNVFGTHATLPASYGIDRQRVLSASGGDWIPNRQKTC